MVASLVTLFKKLKFLTDENVGWGPIDLPELELQTTAYWLTAEAPRERWRRDELDVALMGAGRAIQTVASVLLMVDPRDLGLVTQVRSPHSEEPTIYLYEAVPGGIGLSERLWERHDELIVGAADLIRACACDAGCPACTGPRLEPDIDARALSLRLLDELGAGRPDERGPVIDQQALLVRRLARYRAGDRPTGDRPGARSRSRGPGGPTRAERMAAAVGGEVRTGPGGSVVWCTSPPRSIPVDRTLLADLPGHPDPTTPLLCLDTETTGLATAAGTVAWLVGLGWWVGDSFHQVQLLVPDHADEPAMLAALDDLIPADGWLVTYNGRGFDWPLLVARYGSTGRPPPTMPATWTCCRSFAGCSGTGWPMHGSGPPRRNCSGSIATAMSMAGRSRACTWGSCAAGRPRHSRTSCATTIRTSGRSPACSGTSAPGSPIVVPGP